MRLLVQENTKISKWGRRDVPLLNYNVAFALQLRKSTENISQRSQPANANQKANWGRSLAQASDIVPG
jgi:hypothetical protein